MLISRSREGGESREERKDMATKDIVLLEMSHRSLKIKVTWREGPEE